MDILIWFIAVQAAGLTAFPLLFRLLPRIPDRGYSVSKPLGLLLLGYLSWILSQLHVLPSTQLTLLLILGAMAAASGAYAYRRRRRIAAFLRAEWRTVVAVELVFLLLFAGWAFLRTHDPGISHTEQPMDFSFLNASVRTFYGTPEDPWLRGESVSYYYFGHWVAGAVAELTGIATRVAYNLALASSAALAGAAAFGLAYNLVRWRGKKLRTAIGAGLLAAGLLTVCSNLEGTFELLRAAGGGSASLWSWVAIDGLQGEPGAAASWRPDDPWWWWRATRVINTFVDGQGLDYTIQEFPAFSYILGDLHAHVTSLPFVLLFLTLCLGLFTYRDLTPARLRRDRWPSVRWTPVTFVLLLGLTLGGVGFTNMWDLPVFAAAFLGLAFLRSYAQAGGSFLAAASRAAPRSGPGDWLGLPVLPAVSRVVHKPVLRATSRARGHDAATPLRDCVGPLTVRRRPIRVFSLLADFESCEIPSVGGAGRADRVPALPGMVLPAPRERRAGGRLVEQVGARTAARRFDRPRSLFHTLARHAQEPRSVGLRPRPIYARTDSDNRA